MSRRSRTRLPDNRSRPQGLGPSTPPGRYAAAVVCALLLAAVALVFGQTLRHEFVNYDDDQYVYNNPQVVRGFTAQGVDWAFMQFHCSNWHPLTWLSHMLDCQLYGLNHVGGHHLTNVLLHASSALLLFLVLRKMTGDLWPCAFVAALFAIHPLHVESVAWVAERKDVLSGIFFMLTLAAYAGYARRPFSLLRYLLVTVLFALGLLAKPMLVTLPFVLLLLDYWPLRRGLGAVGGGQCEGSRSLPTAHRPAPRVPRPPTSFLRLIVEKLPWLVLAAASCVMTYSAQGTAVIVLQRIPLPTRIANALVSSVAYLGHFFYPVGLAVFSPHPQYSLPVGRIVGSELLLAGISLAVVAWWRKYPYLPVGWLWYLGMLVPVIGLVQVGFQAMADRYTYLTQIGPYIALAWGAKDVTRHWTCRRSLCGAGSAMVVAALMCCAWRQVSYWKDDEALWSHTLDCTSNNCVAHGNLGRALAGHRRLDEAIVHYRQALEIEPNYTETHGNLGNALAAQGKLDEAIQHYLAVLRLNPRDDLGHVQLGVTLARQGKLHEAELHFREALRLRPANADARSYLAKALQEQGQLPSPPPKVPRGP